MKIACLGWGSLVWRPESLKVQRQWFNDGPLLPIEFTRQSRDGRLTLVINKGSKLVRVLWALMDTSDIEEAKKSLQDREGIKKENINKHIGVIKINDATEDTVLIEIRDWAKALKLDAVIWTALESKFDNKEIAPTADQAVNYLRELEIQKKTHAEEYIRRTPKQIDTNYRQRFESEFNWTCIE